MEKFKVGDRVRHVGGQSWSHQWQDCVLVGLADRDDDYYVVQRVGDQAEGLMKADEMMRRD